MFMLADAYASAAGCSASRRKNSPGRSISAFSRFKNMKAAPIGSRRLASGRFPRRWAYFFEGLNSEAFAGEYALNGANGFEDAPAEGVLEEKETIDLVRYYYQLNKEPRRRLLDLAKALSGTE